MAPAPDVLECEPAPLRRGRVAAAGALVLVAALLAGAAEVRERRAAAAQERRLDAVVDVSVQPEGGGTEYDAVTGRARLQHRLLLSNDGPRGVTVTGAAVAGYALVQDEVRVAAGRSAPLLLERSVTCSASAPPRASGTDTLALQLTTAAGPRAVDLDLDVPLSPDEAAHACGFVPLDEAASVAVTGATRPGDLLVLGLQITVTSARPVELLAVEVGPGLRSELASVGGRAVPLPLALPTASGPAAASSSHELRIAATDCDAAVAGAGFPDLTLRLRDEDGRQVQVKTLYELGYLMDLLLDVC